MPTLTNKVAFITGGSRGIGAAIAKRLAAEGAIVVFTYSASPDKANAVVADIESAGGKALALQADSADATALIIAIHQAVKTFGQLDIFVNNAGILRGNSIDTLSIEELDKMLAVNVRSVVIGVQAAQRHMPEGGRIITIGSVVADKTNFPNSSIYSLTKGAVASFVRGVAIDLAPRNITVNNVQPGPTTTDMNPADSPHAAMILNLLPLKRYGKDTEVASLVAYLATPEAAFITGASITIDGGYLA